MSRVAQVCGSGVRCRGTGTRSRRRLRRGIFLVTFGGVSAVGGCNCDSATEAPADPVARSVEVTIQGAPSPRVDETVDVTARATTADGASVSTTFTWSSSNQDVATVAALDGGRARITVTGIGDVTITATESSRSVKGSVSLTTRPPALSQIRVLPADPTVALDGMLALSAEPVKQSDGSIVDVPLTWTSSDPGVATVSATGSSLDAVVIGVSEGTATITVVEPSQPSVIGSAALTVEIANGIVKGTVYDIDDVTRLDSVFLTMGPTANSTGTTVARGTTGRQIAGDPDPIPPGSYRFEADPGEYALFSVAVLGNRWVSTPGDTILVTAGDTIIRDLNVKRGYHLNMISGNLGTIQATAGASIGLNLTFQVWNRDLCPGCVPSVAIGVDGTPLNVYRFGQAVGVYPGLTRTASIGITVPAQGGTIYAMLVTTSTAAGIQPGLDQYAAAWAANLKATRFIPIGTLVVN